MADDAASRFDWQQKAIDRWLAAGGHGIVEAMTGTGKSHVGLAAIRRLVEQGYRVNALIVVPTRALLSQWLALLRRAFPDHRFGQIGDGEHDTFAQSRDGALPLALVSTVHSAVKAVEDGLFDHCNIDSTRSLLIADECHRYANEDKLLYNRILRHSYDYALGLSATAGQFEIAGLGRIVHEYTLTEAVRDGLVPKFDVLNVGVGLSPSESTEYLRLGQVARQIQQTLQLAYPQLEFLEGEEYWNFLRGLKKDEDGNEDPLVAKLFVTFFKRAALSYEAHAKLELVPQIIELLVGQARKKLLVFFERIWTAEMGQDDLVERTAEVIRRRAANAVSAEPIWCKLYHSKLSDLARGQVLDEFLRTGPSALLACRSLDEGLDVPAVDGAILVASTQSARQRLQRIGRTLRRGDGTKRPLIVILHVQGTSDRHVAIAANDPAFADAADVHDVTARDLLARLRELTGLAPVESKPAAAPPKPGQMIRKPDAIDPAAYQWTAATPINAPRFQIVSALQRAASNTPLRLLMASGQEVTGLKRLLTGSDLLLSKTDRTLNAAKIRQVWIGRSTS